MVNTLNEIKKLNVEVIKKIYDLSKGQQRIITISTLQDSDLKLDEESIKIILDFAKQQGYIQEKKSGIILTEKGVNFIKELFESPRKHNITNILKIFGDINQSQIQQQSSESNQEIKNKR